MQRRAGEVKTEDEEAVSPIIGVILMVAITVIIATVVSAFALTLGQDNQNKPISAAVEMDVDQQNQEINIHVTSMGNAEFIIIRGPLNATLEQHPSQPYLNHTGQSITLTPTHLQDHGSVAAVAVRGNFVRRDPWPPNHPEAVPTAAIIPVEEQTQVNVVDYDFR